MYLCISKKSNRIHHRYKINSFPIPLYLIEQIIIDQGFDIIISDNLTSACILRKTVFLPNACDSETRVLLVHELGHIICHHFKVTCISSSDRDKFEAQANAFSVYFLIPISDFLTDAKIYNVYELSEIYGVTVDFINTYVTKYLLNQTNYCERKKLI